MLRIEEELSAAHLRLANVVIEHLPWADCVKRYDREATLFYLDPSYWEAEGYGVDFPWSEYERLAELLRFMKGSAVVSIQRPSIRQLFGDFTIVPL